LVFALVFKGRDDAGGNIMKIAVTGGCGFVGRWLLAVLPETIDAVVLSRSGSFTGSRLIPLSRSNSAANINERDFAVAQTDYSHASLCGIIAGCDAMVHLAARRPEKPNDAGCLRNTMLDFNVFAACEETGIGNIVFASSRNVYGKRPTPWKESTRPAPDNPYALAKLHSEQSADYFNRRGLNIKSLRIAQVLGLGERENSMVSTFLQKAYRKETITLTVSGSISREYINVKDVASAVFAALAGEKTSGVFNLGSGKTCSIEELAGIMNRIFNNKDNIQAIPNPAIIHENSLMDSTLFENTFKWTPKWTIETSIIDIKKTMDASNSFSF
jgi:UDP-glucose 4-epimerase